LRGSDHLFVPRFCPAEVLGVTSKVPVGAVIVLIIAVSLGAAGQLCLKHGVNMLGEDVAPLVVIRSIFTVKAEPTKYIDAGFVLYAISSLFYLVALSRLELSFAYPFVALSFVIVLVLSWVLLNETLPPLRWVGMCIIVVGVLTVAASYRGGSMAAPPPPASVEQPQ